MISDPAFANAGKNWAQWSDELDARVARLERGGTFDQLEAQYKAQLLKARTCPECEYQCKTMWHLDHRHRGSKVCLKRIAENLGNEFVPPSRERVTCKCGITVIRGNLPRHQEGDLHKNLLAKKNGFYCHLCDKSFKGKRPKKAFNAHCKLSKKHLRLESVREEGDVSS